MPQYHFNVHDGLLVEDADGYPLPGLAEAKQQAVLYAADLIRDHAPRFWDGEEWRMDVTDDDGLTLFSLILLGITAPAGQEVAPITALS